MKKLNDAVKREALYIAVMVLLMSIILQAVFLIIQQWNYTVLLGNIFGGAVAVINFLLMGITVQMAVEKEEKEARSMMKLSQTLRMFMILISAVIGVLLPCFNNVAMLVPLLFPRVAIMFRPLFGKFLPYDKN